jgi:uncharacterized repeat protein (TIGR03803 family)
MNKPIYVGLATGETLRLFIAVVLLVSASGVFNVNAQTVTILYSFGSYRTDGQGPLGGLVQGSDGNFYGTTSGGGTGTNCPAGSLGCGTVYRISPSGSETVLYSFAGYPTDGHGPNGLVQGSDGNFYGTTLVGGGSDYGTVFRISPSGNETNLYSFTLALGDYPQVGLVLGSDGNFYGTISGGLFGISPGGSNTSLYSFGGSSAVFVLSSDGNFYGTTSGAGTYGFGTVFRISPSGNYTNLYSFVGRPNDGYQPQGGLVQGSDGNFYGTTVGSTTNNGGGMNNGGTVFRISPSGSETVLHFFPSIPNDGGSTQAGLVQGSDGNFYGTTSGGGMTNWCSQGCGTIFKLTVPLGPPPYPINQITGVQLSGTNVVFSIPSIAYETYQLQFSSSMNPTNWVNVPVSITNSIGALLTLTNFGGASQPQGFYRFDITP